MQSSQVAKDSQKKVEKVIDSILKELGMSRKEFEEVNLSDIVHTQLLDNISKMKASKRIVFKFRLLLTPIFFYMAKMFLSISHWEGNECTMQLITHMY